MAPLLRVEGSWPGAVTITAGWLRARARPWNETIPDPILRLDRGGPEFLTAATHRLEDMGATRVYSPALYGASTRVWRRSGFADHTRLLVMERSLDGILTTEPDHEVEVVDDPDWDRILEIDRAAFSGFWGMSKEGLLEAHSTSRAHALLTVCDDGELSGYSILGAQWGVAYLHRIAIHPRRSGQGLGTALLAASMGWGRSQGANTMVLNVRRENEQACRLYQNAGFVHTGTDLVVLRHDAV